MLDLLSAIEPLTAPLYRLAGSCDRWVSPDIAPFFRDVSDALVRSVERARNLYNLLTTVLEANQTQVSIRQNEDMRKITAWVAIAAVPTMIAGIYGMNFDHMPELRSLWGYPADPAGHVHALLLLYRRFKQSEWL